MEDTLFNRQGFTLIELIAVLLLIGILGALAIPRFIELDATANLRAVDAAVSELNGREGLIWAEIPEVTLNRIPSNTSAPARWSR